jgi:hypothetical protein
MFYDKDLIWSDYDQRVVDLICTALQSPSFTKSWSQSERMSMPFLLEPNGHVLWRRIFLDQSGDELPPAADRGRDDDHSHRHQHTPHREHDLNPTSREQVMIVYFQAPITICLGLDPEAWHGQWGNDAAAVGSNSGPAPATGAAAAGTAMAGGSALTGAATTANVHNKRVGPQTVGSSPLESLAPPPQAQAQATVRSARDQDGVAATAAAATAAAAAAAAAARPTSSQGGATSAAAGGADLFSPPLCERIAALIKPELRKLSKLIDRNKRASSSGGGGGGGGGGSVGVGGAGGGGSPRSGGGDGSSAELAALAKVPVRYIVKNLNNHRIQLYGFDTPVQHSGGRRGSVEITVPKGFAAVRSVVAHLNQEVRAMVAGIDDNHDRR